jgi:hypothetical protein
LVGGGQRLLHHSQVGLCMAGAAEQSGPSNFCSLRARDWSIQLVVGKSMEESDPLLGNPPQLIY